MSTGLQDQTLTPPPSSSGLLPNEMKSPTAFRTISEVAEDVSLPQHVLRFWESKFQQINPLKRGGGRRYYRPEDVQVIHDIKDLLYNQGFTIRGVQKLLRDKSHAHSLARSMVVDPRLPITMVPVAHKEQPQSHVHASSHSMPSMQPQDLSPVHRREVEGVLAELKSLRKLLQQSGI